MRRFAVREPRPLGAARRRDSPVVDEHGVDRLFGERIEDGNGPGSNPRRGARHTHIPSDVDARATRASTQESLDNQVGGIALADTAGIEHDLGREAHHVDVLVDRDPLAALPSVRRAGTGDGGDLRERPVVSGADDVAEDGRVETPVADLPSLDRTGDERARHR
jgi:hypothetical protein